jgi:SAM-dependent MidA family methyltransferase
MNALEQKIIERIKREGPLTFETFMEMALYEPTLGYYATDSVEIGKGGDFYTSQHVHAIFGSMIGKQIKEMWQIMGKPQNFITVEPGAGSGHLCKDILEYLNKESLLDFITYVIIEINPFLQKKQRALLENYSDKVSWASSLRDLGKVRGCIISNELLDSFPVHMIAIEGDLKEIYVTADKNNLNELKGHPKSDALIDYINEFSLELPEGYRTEINLRIKDWLSSVHDILEEGFIFTIDYGYPSWNYYSPERNRGTLLCYHKHQTTENPYINVGEQDMTAHVNFSSLKKWGEEFGFKTLGFCHQGTYLVSLGIDEMIQELLAKQKEYLFEVAKIKKLILPGTMGETHKVIIQYKGKEHPELRGFSIKNQRDKL